MKRTVIFLLLAFTVPAFAQAPAINISYTQFTLPNGLHVILHEDHTVPTVTVNTWRKVGSAHETPHRTGFAHLFEHLMFMGSGHVKPGEFDTWLEMAGGDNNASTANDRTNYFIDVPKNSFELALFLESDRTAYLIDTMTPKTVDAQRDVVKNERRQRVENQPYGMAFVTIGELLYPQGNAYDLPAIGYMDDLTAASYEDVVGFFKKWYTPANSSLVIAGDIDPVETKRLVEKWFGDVKGAPAPEKTPAPGGSLKGVTKKPITDNVQLPRIYLAWLTPKHFAPGDAALDVAADVLAGGKNSRLYKRLVYDMQIAQSVNAFQASADLSSSFQIIATPRPGHTIDELQKVIDEEVKKLQTEPPTAREMERSLNQREASFYGGLEKMGSFGGLADQMNAYFTSTGDPNGFEKDLARYRVLKADDVKTAAAQFLPLDKRVELTVEPEKKP